MLDFVIVCSNFLNLAAVNLQTGRLPLHRPFIAVDQIGGQHAAIRALLDHPNLSADEIALQVLDQRPGQLAGQLQVGLVNEFRLFQFARLPAGGLLVLVEALGDLPVQLPGEYEYDLEVDQALDHRLVQTGDAAHLAVLRLNWPWIDGVELEVPVQENGDRFLVREEKGSNQIRWSE